MKNPYLIGILFALSWSSASVATKIGLQVAEPLVINNMRFVIAGALMLAWAHLYKRHPLPQANDWLPLSIYGALNVAIYLGAFILAMQYVSAGIGTLAVATNPLMISILSAVVLRKTITTNLWLGLALGMIGIGIATYPLLQDSRVTPLGLAILAGSMLSYSIGTVYYARQAWTLPRITINGWQVMLGGLLILPFTIMFSDLRSDQFLHPTYWGAVLWLAIPVSIGAVQLWLYLLSLDTMRASLWLFLCPIFGFGYARVFTGEPITMFTVIGTVLVLVGLWIGQKK